MTTPDTRTGDRHLMPPFSIRLDADLQQWIEDYAARHATSRNAAVAKALAEFRYRRATPTERAAIIRNPANRTTERNPR